MSAINAYVISVFYVIAMVFLVSMFFSISFSVIAYLNQPFEVKQKFRIWFVEAFAVSVPLGIAASCAGYLTGISRLPAVSDLLPAALSLISAIFIWTMNAQSPEKLHSLGCGVCVFSLSMLLGVMSGSDDRESGRMARLQAISEQERQIRIYRTNRDLPVEIPNWVLTGEGIYK